MLKIVKDLNEGDLITLKENKVGKVIRIGEIARSKRKLYVVGFVIKMYPYNSRFSHSSITFPLVLDKNVSCSSQEYHMKRFPEWMNFKTSSFRKTQKLLYLNK